MKPQPEPTDMPANIIGTEDWALWLGGPKLRCPFGKPGDRLWVRETFAVHEWNHWPDLPHRAKPEDDGDEFPQPVAYYRASFDRAVHFNWTSPMNMQRWASRITLEVTDVRVERVQAITENDAVNEGMAEWRDNGGAERYAKVYGDKAVPALVGSAAECFAFCWDEIYKARGLGWHANPWVWVCEFKRVQS